MKTPPEKRIRYPLIERLLPYSLLIIFAGLCFSSQLDKSVTVDEFCHLPSGIYNIMTFDWRMDRESPPFVKCLTGLGALLSEPELSIKAFQDQPNPWGFGYDFMFRNDDQYRFVFVLGRCVVILLASIGGFILFKFAAQIYGYGTGLFVMFLYVFNPNVIAHSRLTTIDMGATSVILFSLYAFWRFLKAPGLKTAGVSGFILGLAQLSKFTALIFIPVLCLIGFLSLVRRILEPGEKGDRKTFAAKYIGYVGFLMLVSLLVINGGYLFSGSFTPLGQYPLESDLLQKLKGLLGENLPVPLPYDYLAGFDTQLAISQGGNPFYEGYLMGERSTEGWWYYFLVAFAVKNPAVLSVLLILAGITWVTDKDHRPDFETGLCIWLPLVVFFVYFSLFTHVPIGVRFLLPIFPLCFMACGFVCHSPLISKRMKTIGMAVFLPVYLISALGVFPNYLSYFTTAVGGPKKGHEWLIESNLDWGQDLPGLKAYMDENSIEKINLGYFGRVDPAIYGIDYELVERELEEGVCAISVNFLVGRPYYLLNADTKQLTYIGQDYYKRYRGLTPKERIGHSIYLFEIEKNGKKDSLSF